MPRRGKTKTLPEAVWDAVELAPLLRKISHNQMVCDPPPRACTCPTDLQQWARQPGGTVAAQDIEHDSRCGLLCDYNAASSGFAGL